jgi:hypothetical protein
MQIEKIRKNLAQRFRDKKVGSFRSIKPAFGGVAQATFAKRGEE